MLALVHGVTTGSDTRSPAVALLYIGSGLVVLALLGAQLLLPSLGGCYHPGVARLVAIVFASGVVLMAVGLFRPG